MYRPCITTAVPLGQLLVTRIEKAVKSYLTMAGPQAVFSAVSPPVMPTQLESIVNKDKGIAVTVPHKGGVLILIRLGGIENGNGLVVDGDVDSGNLVVHCRDQFNASNFGNLSQDFGAVPGIEGERGTPIRNVSIEGCHEKCSGRLTPIPFRGQCF